MKLSFAATSKYSGSLGVASKVALGVYFWHLSRIEGSKVKVKVSRWHLYVES